MSVPKVGSVIGEEGVPKKVTNPFQAVTDGLCFLDSGKKRNTFHS